jgi:2-polyprenyl-6-methoxyphenol hydroxylase-like FAD-dependent oxidoreductase
VAQSSFDIIVAGAGPAGASLALRLARAGRRTALVDPALFPRQKVCGEYLTASAWRNLDEMGLSALRAKAVELDAMNVAVPSGRHVDCRFEPDSRPAALSRYVLDDQLVGAAVRAGVELFLERRVRHVRVRDGAAVGVTLADVRHAGDSLELDAPLVVAADGRRSQVVRDTGELRSRPAGLVGYKRHLHVDDMRPFSGRIAMHSLPGGYLGVCPVDDRTVNLCGLLPKERLQAARGDVTAALRNWLAPAAALHELLDACPADNGPSFDDDALSRWSTMPDVAPQSAEPRVGGVLYVGDAMQTIEPLTGQGMTIALASARLAAEEIVDAPRGRIDADRQRRYALACRLRFQAAIRWSNWFARLLRTPRTVAALMTLAGPSRRLSGRILTAVHNRTLTAT